MREITAHGRTKHSPRARTDAPPALSGGISAIGLGDGKGGIALDPYYARLLKPVLEKLDREVHL
jgi:hypothetical protein